MKLYWDVEQGTAAWMKLRQGIPTASCFDQILTPKTMKPSESRHKYACRLIAERLLNWQADSLEMLEHIANGKAREPDAIHQLEFTHEIKTLKIGFVTSDNGRIGASPDRMVEGSMHPVEVKCPNDPTHLQYMLLDREPGYRCQAQGQIWLTEADQSLFYSYHPRMPEFLLRTKRDIAFINALRSAVEQFCDELDAMTEKAKQFGIFQAYESFATPVEAARGEELTRGPTEPDIAHEPTKHDPGPVVADLAAAVHDSFFDGKF